MEKVIIAENISKKFKLYYDRPLTLKERIVKGAKGDYKEFYALKDVSFYIEKGSTVGLIGQNGSGKSTLLKIINRTMFPDNGKLQIKGKVASLIELGAGFHPELSGRENIYNNATVFGFTKEEIDKRVPDIIRFSELENFIDNPIRTYSSGMYARLAFSVAIHVDADILLVDEILGVGDMNFQSKCANKIFEMRKKGTTILIVTHDMSTIDRLCDYGIWLEQGVKIAQGQPKKIQNQYLEFMSNQQDEKDKVEKEEKLLEEESKLNKEENIEHKEILDNSVNSNRIVVTHLGEHFGNGDVVFTSCELLNDKGVDKRSFHTGEKIKLKVEYLCQVDPKLINLNIGFEISNNQGTYIYGTNTTREGNKDLFLNENGFIEVELDPLMLLPGEYAIGIAVADVEEKTSYDHYHKITEFRVYSNIHDAGIVRIPHQFILDGVVIGKEEE